MITEGPCFALFEITRLFESGDSNEQLFDMLRQGLTPSAQRPKTDASDRLEMLPIPGDDRQPVLDRRRRDQCVGKPDSELTGDASPALGDSTVHGDLAEWGEELDGEVGCGVAGDQLGPRDHGVVHAMASWPQLDRAAKMVDEDISIYEEVSHDASRHENE